MKHTTKTQSADIDSLNALIVNIDIDELEVEALEERIELTLAFMLGDTVPTSHSCGQFSCSGYFLR